MDDGEVCDDDGDEGFAAGPFAAFDGAVGAGLYISISISIGMYNI